MTSSPAVPFDFEAHRREAMQQYQKVRPLYEEFSEIIQSIIEEALSGQGITVASVESRPKPLKSFGDKVVEPSPTDPNRPKYGDPLTQIKDLAAARIITFFPKTIESIDKILNDQFVVVERGDKTELLKKEEKLGYQSVHYIVKLRANRTILPEYVRYKDLDAEIQVRTILQHAWAEIEHDIQYKSIESIPSTIRRRFTSLAGLLEIADHEFQAIQDEDQLLRLAARASVQQGRLDSVEITPDALKTYLDKKLGADGRMTLFSYDFEAGVLRKLGFENFAQVDSAIAKYNDDQVSRIAWGTRQGQLTRFELVLLAAMSEYYVQLHPWSNQDWFRDQQQRYLDRLRKGGVQVGNYQPTVGNIRESTI